MTAGRKPPIQPRSSQTPPFAETRTYPQERRGSSTNPDPRSILRSAASAKQPEGICGPFPSCSMRTVRRNDRRRPQWSGWSDKKACLSARRWPVRGLRSVRSLVRHRWRVRFDRRRCRRLCRSVENRDCRCFRLPPDRVVRRKRQSLPPHERPGRQDLPRRRPLVRRLVSRVQRPLWGETTLPTVGLAPDRPPRFSRTLTDHT